MKLIKQLSLKYFSNVKINKKMETTHKIFKPFDKVLVRDDYNEWYCGFYSHWCNAENNHALTSTGHYRDDNILPYKGNEHLVGTTDETEGEVKLEEGEWIVCTNEGFLDQPQCWIITKYSDLYHNSFLANGRIFNYAVKFSDFNPDDMKETAKHILCVKNGKIVKYKG